MFGHEHYIECCALAPPSAYKYLAPLAGLKKPPAASSLAEFMATGARDKTIRLWDSRGTCLTTLIGHDNWVRALVFHPGGKYLLSAADDKTVRCWDLSQDGRCVRVVGEPHERFISSLRWAPSIVRSAAAVSEPTNGGTPGDSQNGAKDATTGDGAAGQTAQDVQIRCVIATGGVDWKLRIFSS